MFKKIWRWVKTGEFRDPLTVEQKITVSLDAYRHAKLVSEDALCKETHNLACINDHIRRLEAQNSNVEAATLHVIKKAKLP